MSDSVLRDKSKEYAKNIIFLCRKLKENRVEGDMVGQLRRAGTSVGANIYEAQYAQGPRDFISKFEIALKECNESEYWLELIYETGGLAQEDFENRRRDCIELRRMLVATVTTMKNKL